MDDLIAATIVVIEKNVSTLNRVSTEMTTEDLQKRTIVYKKDKGHVAVYMKLR